MARPSRLTKEVIESYFSLGLWQRKTVSDHWDQNAILNPKDIAVSDRERRLSWAEAKLWTDRTALALIHLGLRRDELLVIQLPNCAELPLLRVACEKAGVLCLPVSPTLRHSEMRHCLRHTEASALVVPALYRSFNYAEMARELQGELPHLRYIVVAGEDVPPGALSLRELTGYPWEEKLSLQALATRRYRSDEVSLINSTTGSTGPPKFAEYTAAARLLYGRGYVEVFGLRRQDVLAALSPAAGGPNIPVYFAAPQIGARIVLLSHFEPEAALELIEKESVTVACLVPAQLALLTRQPRLGRYDLSSVRFWLSVGAPLPSSLAREAEERLGGIVLNCYGAVDWGGVVFTSPEDPPQVRYSTVGRPYAGTELRIVDAEGIPVPRGEIGEIEGRGPSCSSGYFRDPEATQKTWTPDGWLPMGDLGQWDERGNLIFKGRKKDLIIRGGENIQPAEIETLLLSHPKIKQAAVVGMPDPVMGEKVCAYVVPRSKERPTLEEIASFLRSQRIAPFKLPERLELVDNLPMIGGTKVDRKALADDIAAKVAKGYE